MAINRGTTLESFATVGDWTLSAGTLLADAVNVREGAANLQMSTPNDSWCQMTKTVSWNLSAMTNIAFRFFCPVATRPANVKIRIAVDSGVTKYFEYTFDPQPGWNDRVMAKAQFTAVGGAVAGDWAAIIRLVVRQTSNSGLVGQVTPDLLSKEYQGIDGRGIVIISLDDNRVTNYDYVWPQLAARDIRWTSFCHTGSVGNTGLCTLAQMKELYADGVDIAAHGHAHLDLTSLTAAEMASDLSSVANYLKTNGFYDSAPFFAYPYGGYNAAVVAAVSSVKRFAMARTVIVHTDYAHQQPDGLVEFYLPGYGTDTIAASALLATIDNIILSKGVLVLLFHNFVTSSAGTSEYLKSEFETLANGLVTRIGAGTLWVPTLSEYWRRLERLYSRGPVWKDKKLYPRTPGLPGGL